MRQKLISKLFPRSWSLVPNGGIEIRRILPKTFFSKPLYRWSLFARAQISNGSCRPIDTFGQAPIATGLTWGLEGFARFEASSTLLRLQGHFDG